MILTNKQEEGLRLCVERYNLGEPYTCISGYAGTGKSTLVKFIIAALNLNPEDVAYVAFTGKAAKVLAQKGCPNATTAHKLLYYSSLTSSGTYVHKPKLSLDYPYKLIVVDEISMLPINMWNLLLSHKIPIICCGDPEQLPPINSETDNCVLNKPHVFLDEIMRQAAESEIIRLSMHVRQGNNLNSFNGANQQVKILTKSAVNSGMYEWADQIICATNNLRNEINAGVRSVRGYGPTPHKQDKIISLSNHWDFCSRENTQPLTNGNIGIIKNYWIEPVYFPRYILEGVFEIMRVDMEAEDGETYTDIPIDYKYFLTGKDTLTKKQKYQMSRNKRCMDPPFEFTYGYAITCHKAQGSEWNNLLIFEEKFPFDKEEHRRWLYTAITRASEKVVIIKK